MSKRQITMEAGRDLDALVAEKVMGWVVICGCDNRGQSYSYLGAPRTPEEFHTFKIGAPDDPNVQRQDGPPPYSTDIAAAWQVLEKVVDGRRDRSPTLWLDKSSDLWVCEFGNIQGSWSATAPLAICRATLLVLMDREG